VLHKKNINGERESCIHHIPHNRGNFKIWNLMLVSIPLISYKLTLILRNGKSINFWTKGIVGNPPLGSNLLFHPLRNLLISQDKISMWDASSYSSNKNLLS